MEKEELRVNLKNEIKHYDKEMLHLASTFIYNWIEGPWTPQELSSEEIKELKKRLEEAKKGKGIPHEEVISELRKKYNLTEEKSAKYKAQYLKELKTEVMDLLDELDESGMIRLDQFLKSQSYEDEWDDLTQAEKNSVERGIKDADNGRLVDVSEVIKEHS